jgi:hypothetical protein
MKIFHMTKLPFYFFSFWKTNDSPSNKLHSEERKKEKNNNNNNKGIYGSQCKKSARSLLFLELLYRTKSSVNDKLEKKKKKK